MNADNWKRYAEQGLIKAIEDYDIPTYIRDIAAEVKKENPGRGIYSIYGRRGGDDFEALPKGLCCERRKSAEKTFLVLLEPTARIARAATRNSIFTIKASC